MAAKKPSPIKTKTMSHGPVDQSELELNNLWMRRRPGKKSNVEDTIVPLVKKSKEFAILYSPMLTHPELIASLEKLSRKGVRVYAVTSNVKNHKSIFNCGIMREAYDVLSTYVLVDPLTNPQGIWYPGKLTSKWKMDFHVKLSNDQVNELWEHFLHDFWNNDSTELFFGDLRKCPELRDRRPDTPTTMEQICRRDFFILSQKEIREMTVPPNKPPEFDHYYSVEKLVLPMGEESRDVLDEIDIDNIKVRGKGKVVAGQVILDTGKKMVFAWDLGIFLEKNQEKEVGPTLSESEWLFHPTITIGEINNDIILEEDKWDKPQPRSIGEETTIRMDDILCKELDDWLEERKAPYIPEDGGLFRRVTYTWNLEPPKLPRGVKEHRLYAAWDKFAKELDKKANRLLADMKKGLDHIDGMKVKKTKKITMKSRIESLSANLEAIRNKDWSNLKSIRDVEKNVDKISETRKEYLTIIEGDVSKLTKKKESNELEAILKLSKRGEKKLEIPPRIMPSTGVLYEKGNKSFLVISNIEEIPDARKEADKHRAIIVVKGGN